MAMSVALMAARSSTRRPAYTLLRLGPLTSSGGGGGGGGWAGLRSYHAGAASARAALVAGPLRAQLQPAARRVWRAPVRHSSGNSRVPRGFENFGPKGGKGKKAAAEGKKPEAAETAEAAEGAKAGGKSTSSGGAGKKQSKKKETESKDEGGAQGATGGIGGSMKSMFPQGQNARTMAALLAGAGGLGVLMLAGPSSQDQPGQTKEITFVDFCSQLVETGQVEKVVVANGARAYVYMRSSDGGMEGQGGEAKYHFTIGSVDAFERRLEDVQRQLQIDTFEFVPVSYRTEVSVLGEAARFIPVLLMIAFFAYMRRAAGSGGMPGMGGGGAGGRNPMSVGKSNAKLFNKEKNIGVMFKDVAGLHEAKTEVQEFVHFLKDPKKYEAIGAKIPKGGILHGPPGTGKTLLAKAVAGESGVPFYSISGADFMEMFVGVGPSRVRDLFKKAREDSPCIIFIDEIDAIGRKRGKGGQMGGNDERENTLNQLLVEMDGFKESSGVVVLAATNRVDVLDSALLRPGRMDRQIIIDNPDVRGRAEIFKVHLEQVQLDGEDEEFAKKLAVLTPGMSGADIKNICNEAALHAARNEDEMVGLANFEAAMGRVIGGIERKTRVLNPEEKRTVAWHEAGHAIAGWYCEHALPLLKVSIVPRGSAALGYAQYLPRDQYIYTESQLMDQMVMTLGGRAAEAIVFGKITTGASDDLDKVTKLAYAQVKQFGMNSEIGAVSYKEQESDQAFYRPHSDRVTDDIDAEVRKLIDGAYVRVTEMLTEKRAELDAVAELLLEKEVISHEDMTTLLGERDGQDGAYDYDKIAQMDGPAEPTPA